jgi:hypothetical protein
MWTLNTKSQNPRDAWFFHLHKMDYSNQVYEDGKLMSNFSSGWVAKTNGGTVEFYRQKIMDFLSYSIV